MLVICFLSAYASAFFTLKKQVGCIYLLRITIILFNIIHNKILDIKLINQNQIPIF